MTLKVHCDSCDVIGDSSRIPLVEQGWLPYQAGIHDLCPNCQTPQHRLQIWMRKSPALLSPGEYKLRVTDVYVDKTGWDFWHFDILESCGDLALPVGHPAYWGSRMPDNRPPVSTVLGDIVCASVLEIPTRSGQSFLRTRWVQNTEEVSHVAHP